jgi:hypothetical protein
MSKKWAMDVTFGMPWSGYSDNGQMWMDGAGLDNMVDNVFVGK